MIKYVIFDLDGTLFDTLDTIRYYVNITVEKYGGAPISREECRRFVGRGAKNLIKSVMESRNMDESLFDSIYSDYNEAYDKDPNYLTRPYDGIDRLISGLLENGIGAAILSNKPHAATVGTVGSIMPNTFSAVFGGREGVPLKPDSRALDSVLDAISADISEVAYIGDSDVDVYTMKNSSPALGIAVSWGFRTRDELISAGAEVILDTPDAVLDYILKAQKEA